MNRCKRCGDFFDEDDVLIVKDDPSPSGLSLPEGHCTYRFCPQCGSDDYVEDFHLIDEIDIDEEDESSIIVSFEGKSFMLFLDESGNLECLEVKAPKEKQKRQETKKNAERQEVAA